MDEQETEQKEIKKDALPVEEAHPIARAINVFLHQIRDIELNAKYFIPAAKDLRKELFKEVKKDLETAANILKTNDKNSEALATNKLVDSIRKVERLELSQMPFVLESSLFIGLFSAFDAFTGELLSAIYHKNSKFLLGLNKVEKISDILKNYETLDELREAVLLDEIATFRRKSYILQFEDLEERFNKKITLRKFDNWTKFIECSQRRHLLTHCDGEVSEQYIKVCQEVGYKFEKTVKVGDKLGLGTEYFASSCELIMEVGLKLGHTLWRILFTAKKDLASKEELEDFKAADKHLRKCLKSQGAAANLRTIKRIIAM